MDRRTYSLLATNVYLLSSVEKKKPEVKVTAGRTSYYSSPASVKKSNATASAKATLKTTSTDSHGQEGAGGAAGIPVSGTATPPATGVISYIMYLLPHHNPWAF
ncbi:hypothetical protein EON65_02125 [archaeon]|nr:MAG: hypothetical protein EON65_02125 [archaeon]